MNEHLLWTTVLFLSNVGLVILTPYILVILVRNILRELK